MASRKQIPATTQPTNKNTSKHTVQTGFDLAWKNPFTTQHNLSVNGGSERINYFMSAGYYSERNIQQPGLHTLQFPFECRCQSCG